MKQSESASFQSPNSKLKSEISKVTCHGVSRVTSEKRESVLKRLKTLLSGGLSLSHLQGVKSNSINKKFNIYSLGAFPR